MFLLTAAHSLSLIRTPCRPTLLIKLPKGSKPRSVGALAAAFAERARDLQKQAFSIATRYGQGTNTIRNFLQENHPTEVLEYRDTIYSFVHLAGTAAAFAIATSIRSDHPAKQAQVFLDSFGEIHSYLGYSRSSPARKAGQVPWRMRHSSLTRTGRN